MGTGAKQRDIGSFFAKAPKPAAAGAASAPKDAAKENKRAAAAAVASGPAKDIEVNGAAVPRAMHGAPPACGAPHPLPLHPPFPLTPCVLNFMRCAHLLHRPAATGGA